MTKLKRSMTGEQLKAAREKLGLTVTEAAASLAVSSRTWQRWEASAKPIPEAMVKLFKLTYKLS